MEDDNNTASKLIEIKEILDNPKILMLSYGNYISLGDYVKLKNYITNLQQENQKLRKKNKALQEDAWRNNANLMEMVKEELEKTDCEECEICEDYKSRIEKAIEYIESRAKKAGVKLMSREEELLDILNGRSDE